MSTAEAAKRFLGRKGTKNLTAEQHAAIVALRFTQALSFPAISSQIYAGDTQCGIVYRQASRKAQSDGHDASTIAHLLEAVRLHNKKQRPPIKVADSSELSAELRSDIIEFGSYRPMEAVSDILCRENITLTPKTLKNIMLSHRDSKHNYAIVRGVRTN